MPDVLQQSDHTMSGPTVDWDRVGDTFYRKIKLYEAIFDQDLELENYILRGAPYGGAIGVSQQALTGCSSI